MDFQWEEEGGGGTAMDFQWDEELQWVFNGRSRPPRDTSDRQGWSRFTWSGILGMPCNGIMPSHGHSVARSLCRSSCKVTHLLRYRWACPIPSSEQRSGMAPDSVLTQRLRRSLMGWRRAPCISRPSRLRLSVVLVEQILETVDCESACPW